MALVVPNVAEVDLLQVWLNRALVLKLFSNNVVPAEGDTISTYIEVSGGGYAAKNLVFANWVITPGDPTIASYPDQDFAFTGATNPPGTIYGYYVVVG
ncbi:MAG: hypothetical protein QXE45_04430, partial [Thermoplasmata archaeon]